MTNKGPDVLMTVYMINELILRDTLTLSHLNKRSNPTHDGVDIYQFMDS